MTSAYWLSGNWFGVQVVYARNAKVWRYLMREYAPADMADDPFPTNDGHCCWFPNRKDRNEQIAVVTVHRPRTKELDMSQVVGILTHEAMHVWRAVREKIKETDPSAEFEAYAMQSITQFLVRTYQIAHKKNPWKEQK